MWRIAKASAESRSVCQQGGGILVADHQDIDPKVFKAVYLKNFVNVTRGLAGSDPRTWEGMLGLKAYIFKKGPYPQLNYHPRIRFPGNLTATVNPEWNDLTEFNAFSRTLRPSSQSIRKRVYHTALALPIMPPIHLSFPYKENA